MSGLDGSLGGAGAEKAVNRSPSRQARWQMSVCFFLPVDHGWGLGGGGRRGIPLGPAAVERPMHFFF